MKKLLFILGIISFSFVATACNDDDDDKTIPTTDLPENAQSFLQTHFPDATIRLAKKDNDSYDVYLNNGYEIDFYLDGEWDDVDGKNQALPNSFLQLLPENILTYVSANYPDALITEADKDRTKKTYEITLNNRIELIFDWDGQFLRIDR